MNRWKYRKLLTYNVKAKPNESVSGVTCYLVKTELESSTSSSYKLATVNCRFVISELYETATNAYMSDKILCVFFFIYLPMRFLMRTVYPKHSLLCADNSAGNVTSTMWYNTFRNANVFYCQFFCHICHFERYENFMRHRLHFRRMGYSLFAQSGFD